MSIRQPHSPLPWRAVLSHEQQPQLMYRGLICVLERSPKQWTSVVAASGEAGADRATIDANARLIVTAVNYHHALVEVLRKLAGPVRDGWLTKEHLKARELLAQIDHEQGGA